MRLWFGFVVVFWALQVTGCGGGGWIHPNKPEGAFTEDWNRCENDVIKDPKLQTGNKYLVQQATERCVMKKGWRIKDAE
jgi:hypothetical protein